MSEDNFAIVEIWVGDPEEPETLEIIGVREKIHIKHLDCYNAGESNFYQCEKCKWWQCQSHELDIFDCGCKEEIK